MAPDNASLPSRKRTKCQDTRSSAGDVQPHQPIAEGSDSPAASSRTGLACEACRLRKTRCVGFPVCTWCQQRRQACVRDQNSQTSPLDDWGNQILDAIVRAKNEILGASIGPTANQPPRHASIALPGDSHTTTWPSSQWSTWPVAQGGKDGPLPIPSADGILDWAILNDQLPTETHISTTDVYEPERSIHSKASPDTSINRLARLRQSFEHHFLVRYPIISRPWLARCVRDVAEDGGGWTAEACLVFLVCAVASLHDCPVGDNPGLTPQTTSFSPPSAVSLARPGMPVSRLLTYQYWTMAKRRLGWALDTPGGLLTAQCLCLAGFWHLQNCAPRKAQNMFCRAIDSTSDGSFRPSNTEEKSLGEHIHLLCIDLVHRLDVELGLSMDWGRADVGNKRLPHNSKPSRLAMEHFHNEALSRDPTAEITANLQHLHSIRLDVSRLSHSTSSISSWPDLHALLGYVARCRSRLNYLGQESTVIPEWASQQAHDGESISDSVSSHINVGRKELEARLLRVCLCLYLHLSPSFLQQLDSSTSQSIQSSQDILSEIAHLAGECLRITAEVLQSHLDNWQCENPQSSQPPSPCNVISGPSSHNHEALFAHHFSYTGCLTFLAAHYAKEKGSCGEMDFDHCQSLALPVEWHSLVAGHTSMLLSHEEETRTWRYGRSLSSFVMGPSGEDDPTVVL
ncbi:hypothetical protein LCI18_005273 [Fusarium solani-melongenae]|uniref:Uncharacterized protein n=1 Tax=Fusarium solani subsp. cucurbitae TaxID=2747967 RepID=A0ACD3Z2K9_FUSSC|nr:hypothetical protein LCI18_005273 [Fusarium solani-melongenae]